MQSPMYCWKMTMQMAMPIKCAPWQRGAFIIQGRGKCNRSIGDNFTEQDLLAVLKRLRIKVLVRVRKSLAAVEREERVGNDKKESGYQKKDFGMITGCDEAENGYLNLTLE